MSRPSIKNKATLISAFGVMAFIATYLVVQHDRISLQNPQTFSGYTALAVMIVLMLFNWRKKLSMLPIISARLWLICHLVFGLLMLSLFWLHTNSLWPSGGYEQIIAALFYIVSLSGIIGYSLSRSIPARLRHIGGEVIYDRIPANIYRIREQAKHHIASAAQESGNETLPREYSESLAWFFAKPRFFLSHVTGSGKPNAWRLRKETSLKPFLTEQEAVHFNQVMLLVEYKNQIDAHYSNQRLLKFWLFLHLPIAAMLLIFVGWHVLLVHLYLL